MELDLLVGDPRIVGLPQFLVSADDGSLPGFGRAGALQIFFHANRLTGAASSLIAVHPYVIYKFLR